MKVKALFALEYINRITGQISDIECVVTKVENHPAHGRVLHVLETWGSKTFAKRFVESVLMASPCFTKR